MNEIDYTKTGEQEVNITFTKKEKTYNASFKIIIEAEEEQRKKYGKKYVLHSNYKCK